jgi:hypothetical protein
VGLDYKDSKNDTTYKKMLKPEAMGVQSFQPPVYQLAAARHLSKQTKAGYILLRKLSPKPVLSPGTEDNLFGESPDLRREMAEKGEPNFLNHLDVTWSNLTQGLFATNPKDDQACQYCDFRDCVSEDRRNNCRSNLSDRNKNEYWFARLVTQYLE